VIEADGCDARIVARIAAARPPAPTRPLYLRAPDARLPA
jgi:tRNA threonylcarbamoyladenosine biosynthesis protein TsaB